MLKYVCKQRLRLLLRVAMKKFVIAFGVTLTGGGKLLADINKGSL